MQFSAGMYPHLAVPPLMTKLASWQLLFFIEHNIKTLHTFYCISCMLCNAGICPHPAVPPLMTKLASWQPLLFSEHKKRAHVLLTLGLFGRRVIVVTCVCPSVRLSVCPSVCLSVPIILVNTITQSVYPISPPNLLGGFNMASPWMVL